MAPQGSAPGSDNNLKGGDPEIWRQVADGLTNLGPQYEEIQRGFKEVIEDARKEASKGRDDGQISPLFSPLVAALESGIGKVNSEIGKSRANTDGISAYLVKLADNIVSTDADNSAKINNLQK